MTRSEPWDPIQGLVYGELGHNLIRLAYLILLAYLFRPGPPHVGTSTPQTARTHCSSAPIDPGLPDPRRPLPPFFVCVRVRAPGRPERRDPSPRYYLRSPDSKAVWALVGLRAHLTPSRLLHAPAPPTTLVAHAPKPLPARTARAPQSPFLSFSFRVRVRARRRPLPSTSPPARVCARSQATRTPCGRWWARPPSTPASSPAPTRSGCGVGGVQPVCKIHSRSKLAVPSQLARGSG
jgi:hypothetical protein